MSFTLCLIPAVGGDVLRWNGCPERVRSGLEELSTAVTAGNLELVGTLHVTYGTPGREGQLVSWRPGDIHRLWLEEES